MLEKLKQCFKNVAKGYSSYSLDKLKKERKGLTVLKLLFSVGALFFACFLFVTPNISDAVGRVALVALLASGVNLCLFMYMNFRIYQVEVDVELRLREILEKAD